MNVQSCAVCGMGMGSWIMNREKNFITSVISQPCCTDCYWPVKAVIQVKILSVQGKEEEE